MAAKCPWCKEGVSEAQIAAHKKTCPFRKPVPTITGIDRSPVKTNAKKPKKEH